MSGTFHNNVGINVKGKLSLHMLKVCIKAVQLERSNSGWLLHDVMFEFQVITKVFCLKAVQLLFPKLRM